MILSLRHDHEHARDREHVHPPGHGTCTCMHVHVHVYVYTHKYLYMAPHTLFCDVDGESFERLVLEAAIYAYVYYSQLIPRVL